MRTSGCREYQALSRRSMLSGLSSNLVSAAIPAWVPQVEYSADNATVGMAGLTSDRDIIVTIYLRGGADGLTMCAPYADANYRVLRDRTEVKAPGTGEAKQRALDADGFFGFPPALAGLSELYNAGKLAVVHACGSTNDTRSHFDAQHFMEVGKADKTLISGWIARHLNSISEATPNATVRAIALGSNLPRIMEGGPKTTLIADMNDTGYAGYADTEAERVTWLKAAYNSAEPSLKASAHTAIKTVDVLKAIQFGSYLPKGGANYWTYNDNNPWYLQSFGVAMKSVAALVKANVGIEAIHLDLGGWDTHDNQTSFDPWWNSMYYIMRALGDNLRALITDLAADNLDKKVTVVVMSEFGRSAVENNAGGTDHGHGNCMFVAGGNVRGKRVYGTWPGLVQLYGGHDLKITTDYRAVLGEIVSKRLLNSASLATIFPGYTPPAQWLELVN